MELQLNREPVFLNEVIYDGQTEQGVEFDYVLPDYYPDIFRILKCSLTPGISSYSVSGTQLFIDGAVLIRILYLSDDNVNIHCVEQKYTYSKAVELPKAPDKPKVYLTVRSDYSNCRAVSGRRFDVRGAVSCKIKVYSSAAVEIISGAEPLETKSETLVYCGNRLYGGGQFTVREDIETGAGKGGIIGIMHCDSFAEITDLKIIAGKVVVKGIVKVKALYLVKIDDNSQDTEVMEAEIPVSRIIDIDGLDESFSCCADMRVMECSPEIKPSDSGESRMIGCELTLDCKITANRESNIPVLTDLYSTEYETDYGKISVKTEYSPLPIKKTLSFKTSLECKEGDLEEIFDCRCEISAAGCKFSENGELMISATIVSQAAGKISPSGAPVFMEKSEQAELTCDTGAQDENCVVEPDIRVEDVSFSISGDNSAEIRASICVSGCVYRVKTVSVIGSVSVDSEKPKEKNSDYALKMYYARENEEIFAIAKRYNTRAAAIMEENELEDEILAEPCLLLIPMI